MPYNLSQFSIHVLLPMLMLPYGLKTKPRSQLQAKPSIQSQMLSLAYLVD